MYCAVCKKNKDEGIKFLEVHLCEECLDNITKTRVEDEEYKKYMDIFKDILKECQV
ncbi:sigma factor G inhibitor Gin [Anaerosalibacter bizertensis]|uniref:sigma factor G inhibitor Gin n=1 Tax=Anaerosalibacter bizertensis TaxID=932217 RepID=UPI0017533804|nr:sigma factor G inhibitor Gin [Anaerosalibacter bizertensis]MBU5294251.1 sigma factor G inhibitor Gin [Anaerosalibacter bizertensis]HHV27080.1 sigma-G inhibitor, Gin [Tissierellia bacterium]